MRRRIRVLLTLALALLGAAAGAQGTHPGPRPVALAGYQADGRLFHLEEARGRVVAVVLLSRRTSKPAAPVQDALGAMAKPGQVLVISVVDLMGIPSMFHGMARKRVLAGARGSPMLFLVDEEGTWRKYFGAQPDKRVDILVIDRAGHLRGHFIDQVQLGQAERLIGALRAEAP